MHAAVGPRFRGLENSGVRRIAYLALTISSRAFRELPFSDDIGTFAKPVRKAPAIVKDASQVADTLLIHLPAINQLRNGLVRERV